MLYHLLTFSLFTGIFLFSPLSVFAVNFLQNSDFESGSINPWLSSGGGSAATLSAEMAHGGATSLKVSNDKTASYGFQQPVGNLEGGMFYEVNGHGATLDTNVNSYFLRVAWYASSDGSGTQLSSPNDTASASNTDGQWVQFNQIIQAPSSAKSAKVRLVLTSKTNGTLASAFFDDIAFQESVAPTPTPTPIPTNTPTPTETPTPVPTKTPTPSPKATSTPTKAPSPTLAIMSAATAAASMGSVLGATPLASPTSTVAQSRMLPLAVALALIGLGLALLAGVFVWKKRQVGLTPKDE